MLCMTDFQSSEADRIQRDLKETVPGRYHPTAGMKFQDKENLESKAVGEWADKAVCQEDLTYLCHCVQTVCAKDKYLKYRIKAKKYFQFLWDGNTVFPGNKP